MAVEAQAIPVAPPAPAVTAPTRKRRLARGPYVLWLGGAVIASFVFLTWMWQVTVDAHATTSGVAYTATLIVPAMIAYFGLLHFRTDMRDAFAAGFMVMYFVLVTSAVAFPTVGDLGSEPATIRGTLLGNLTSLMYVVVGFYFGALAIGKAADAVSKVAEAKTATATDKGEAKDPA